MARNDLKLPKKALFMVSNRDYRLSILNGWVQTFKANVPAKVPPHAYKEALQAGLLVCEEQDSDDEVSDTTPAPVATVANPAARANELDQAVLKVLTRNDPEDFKNDNTPKVNKVIAELDPAFDPRPTATEVIESHERLQENLDLADD